MENDGLIYLTELRFPQHGLVQAWLNGTKYGEQFELVATEISTRGKNNHGNSFNQRICVPALKPICGKEEFLYVLQGNAETQKLAEKYTKMVLDFNNAEKIRRCY